MSVMLNFRPLRDITQKREPYKRNPSVTHLTTLTQTFGCYDRTSKLIQLFGFESLRISESSQAKQSSLESMSLFKSTVFCLLTNTTITEVIRFF